jgi:hypothetical protein
LTGARKLLTDLARLNLDERLTRVTKQEARMLEQVRIRKRYEQLINIPEQAAGAGARGFPLWYKFTAYTSETSLAPGPADPPGHRAPTMSGRDQRYHDPPWLLGLPR